VGINGWYIINAIPSNVVVLKSNRILGYTGLLALKLIAVLLLLGAYAAIYEKKNKKALRQTNEELNRTKAELETFVAGLPGGAFRYRADGKTDFQFVSDGLLKILGYSKEEFVQKFSNSFENMIYEEDRKKTLNSIHQQIEKGQFAEVKYRIVTADGCIRWMLNRAQIVTDVDGQREFCAVVVDITDSKKAHKRAKDAMTQLETLSNSIPGGVAQFFYNGVLTLIYASEGFYKLSGYAKGEYAQLPNGEGIWHAHPDDLHHLNSIMKKQISAKEPLSAEYRLSRKDGSIIWVSLCGTRTVNSQDQVIYQCIFTDITSFKNTQQELELGKERYEIAENLSDDILFEYDILTDYIELSPLFTALTGRYPRISNFSKEIYQDEIIHFDDLPEMNAFLREVRLGHSENGVEFRFKTRSGEYIWHRVKIKIIFDAHGEPSKMIGKAYNIDAQKKEMQRLTDKSQRDPLTNLFNKIATQSQIEDDLKDAEKGSRHALMMIDIDDFKAINDNFGHMSGDMVITEISSKLQMLFRTSDVVGRIGGDEFIVFLRDISTDHMIAQKAQAICEIFRNTHEGKHLDYKISGSIGIALYPVDGTTYQELFPKADLALYRAKNLGKDCYAFYNDELHSNL
ncbi:MAG: Two-component sensor histidine kinase, partial [Caproiciproducens sp.]|nr:Two-component sensor histidine kinase [Caproiciproducens sp.]